LRPLAVWAAPDPHESGLFPRGPSHWAERRRELDVAHREDVTRGAEELLRTGATVIPTSGGPLHARLVRFWNGTAVLDCRAPATERSDGRTFTLVDRRELKRGGPIGSGHLMAKILMLDHAVNPELWGPNPPPPLRPSG